MVSEKVTDGSGLVGPSDVSQRDERSTTSVARMHGGAKIHRTDDILIVHLTEPNDALTGR